MMPNLYKDFDLDLYVTKISERNIRTCNQQY